MKPYNLAGHLNEGASLAFSPDGKSLVTGGLDDRVLFSNLETGRRIRVAKGFGGMALSLSFLPSGALVVGGKGPIHILNPEDGTAIGRLVGPEGFVYGVAGDAQRVLGGGQDGRIRCWDHSSMELLWETQVGIGSIHGLGLFPDGSCVVVGERPTFHILNKDGSFLAEIASHRDTITSLAIHPSGTTFATGSEDGAVVIHRSGYWTPISSHNLEGTVSTITFSPCHPLLALSQKYEPLSVFNWRTGISMKNEMEKTEGITSMSWSPDGRVFSGVFADGGVRTWGRHPSVERTTPKRVIAPVSVGEERDEEKDVVDEEVRAGVSLKDPKVIGALVLLLGTLIWSIGQGGGGEHPPRNVVKKARGAIQDEDWTEAASTLDDLAAWQSDPGVSDLVAKYTQSAFSATQSSVKSAIEENRFSEARDLLLRLPTRPLLGWVLPMLENATSGLLSQLESKVMTLLSSDGGAEEITALLDEASSLVETPTPWMELAGIRRDLLEAQSDLNIALAGGDTNSVRDAAGRILAIEPRNVLASEALWQVADQEGIHSSATLSEDIFSLAWDASAQEFLLGTKGGFTAWMPGGVPLEVSPTGRPLPIQAIGQSPRGILLADREGLWLSGGSSLVSPERQVFDLFVVGDDGKSALMRVMSKVGIVVWTDGLGARTMSSRASPSQIAVHGDWIAVAVGHRASLFSLENFTEGGWMDIPSGAEITALAILSGEPPLLVVGDSAGQIWLSGNPEEREEGTRLLELRPEIDQKTYDIATTADGSLFAYETGGEIEVRNRDGSLVGSFLYDQGEGRVFVTFSHEGKGLVAAQGEKMTLFSVEALHND